MREIDIKESLQHIKDDTASISKKVDTLYTKMFIGNGQRSFESRLTSMESNQRNCPARLSAKTENKALKISYVMAFFSLCAVVLSILTFFKGK